VGGLPETAAALFLSPKTVEYHHVYQKLGINSRDQLAQMLAAQTPQMSYQARPREDEA
jgi:DNA-binding CsgD family transcriptional regulator